MIDISKSTENFVGIFFPWPPSCWQSSYGGDSNNLDLIIIIIYIGQISPRIQREASFCLIQYFYGLYCSNLGLVSLNKEILWQ